ncbi:hypothetical protein T492DRAFT_933412 [Pavlovales sp. CCMP2436]|nr:hypothetical protein T492DRAFT_933412 [Pavlovales sp. CCMP2436]
MAAGFGYSLSCTVAAQRESPKSIALSPSDTMPPIFKKGLPEESSHSVEFFLLAFQRPVLCCKSQRA